jgi:hypothetical protein
MSKQPQEQPVTVEDFIRLGKDMMGCSEKARGAMSREDRQFYELFGVGSNVALVAWNLINELDLLPEGGTMTHFPWTLCFLKVYAKQGPMCGLCGGVDHKTLKKWIDKFLVALADLEPHVVSTTNSKIFLSMEY